MTTHADMPPKRPELVLRVLLSLVALGFLATIGRVIQLQTSPSSDLRPYLRAGVRSATLPGVRGDIYDSRGRLLSTTRFGTRLIIDPTLFPADPHEAIGTLCDATGLDPADVGPRILRAQAENIARAERREVMARALALSGATSPDPNLAVTELAPTLAGPRVLKSEASDAAASIAAVTLATDTGSDGAGTQIILEPEGGEVAAEAITEPPAPLPTRPIRYTPVSRVLSEQQVAALTPLTAPKTGIPGLILEQVPVREYAGGAESASLVGLVGFEQAGLVGTEASFEEMLAAQDGHIRFVQNAHGHAMWIETDNYRAPQRGQDLRLSIDSEIQRMAIEELTRGVEDADAAGGRIIVIDPLTGEIKALGDVVRHVPGAVPYPWTPIGSTQRLPEPGQRPRYHVFPPEPARDQNPALGRLRCVTDAYEPGSTFKPFVWAIALSNGVVELDDIIDTGGGHWYPRPGRRVEDVRMSRAATRSWHDVLVFSSNVGMSRVALRLQPRILHDTLARWGFGRKIDIGLPTRPLGRMTSLRNWKPDTTVSVSFGYEVLVTPLHMVRAFSAFCRDGELSGTIPTLTLLARSPEDPSGDIVERILTPDAARQVRAPLSIVADRMERNVKDTPEGGWLYEIFGKSGTSNPTVGRPPAGYRLPVGESGYIKTQYLSSFLAAGPTESPRLVILAIIDDPGPSRIRNESHYGSYVAGPVVRRLFDRALQYMGVPHSPKPVPAP